MREGRQNSSKRFSKWKQELVARGQLVFLFAVR